ncbi:MAG: hypothetical protein ACLGHL_08550 [Actinomycetota bacterium]
MTTGEERPEKDPEDLVDNDELPDRIDPDVPEADAIEQSREWSKAGGDKPKIPADVNEADALDQSREAWSEEDEDRR